MSDAAVWGIHDILADSLLNKGDEADLHPTKLDAVSDHLFDIADRLSQDGDNGIGRLLDFALFHRKGDEAYLATIDASLSDIADSLRALAGREPR